MDTDADFDSAGDSLPAEFDIDSLSDYYAILNVQRTVSVRVFSTFRGARTALAESTCLP